MTIWMAGPVHAQPCVELVQWRVMRTAAGTTHLVGIREGKETGRASSALLAFNIDRMTAQTESGRTYQLLGGPGLAEDAAYVWQQWAIVNGVEVWEDCTAVFLAEARGRRPIR